MIVDTHCHIHSEDYPLDPDEVKEEAQAAGVTTLLCVGTDAQDSKRAITFTEKRDNCFASVGLHPHDTIRIKEELPLIKEIVSNEHVVAVGECGLDYYYEHSPPEAQVKAFRSQIELALEHSKPLIFHVREAFDDFWRILDDYPDLQGVVHSFTSTRANMEIAVQRGLYVAFNGIMTFTQQERQLEAMKATPLNNMLVETDAPFLTPSPYRGKVNSPKNARLVVEFLASNRNESFEQIAQETTKNARNLFGI